MTAENSGNTHEKDIQALDGIRTFSIISIIGYVLSTISFIISVGEIRLIISGISGTTGIHFQAALIVPLILSIVGFIIIMLSLLFLRKGYSLLKGEYHEFRSPYTGIALYFIGLIVVILAIAVVIAAGVTGLVAIVLVGVALIFIGGIMSLLGIILALVVGIFRLDGKYGGFAAAAILFIFGLFLPLFSFIAAILVYLRASKKIREFSQIREQQIVN
ncbi:MAG: DUF973 family protein [Thermoplasmatales archaeon]